MGEVRSRAAHKPHHRPARERQRRQSSETMAELVGTRRHDHLRPKPVLRAVKHIFEASRHPRSRAERSVGGACCGAHSFASCTLAASVCSRHHDRRHHLEASRARANAHPDLECTSGAKGTLRTQTHANSKTWCFAAARQTQPSRAAELSSLERPERALRVERACCAAPRPRPRTPAGHGHEREQPCAREGGQVIAAPAPYRLLVGPSQNQVPPKTK